MGVAGLPPKKIKKRTPPVGGPGLGLLGFPMEGKPVQATRKKKRRGRRRRRSDRPRNLNKPVELKRDNLSPRPRQKGQPPSDVRPAVLPVRGQPPEGRVGNSPPEIIAGIPEGPVRGQPTGEIVRPPGIPTEIGSPRPSRPPVGRRRPPTRAPEGRRRGRRRPYTEEREIPIAREVIMPIEDFGPKGPMPFDPRNEMRVLDKRERKAQRTDSREMKRARILERKERRMDR